MPDYRNFSMGCLGSVTQSPRRHSLNGGNPTWRSDGYSMGLGKRFRDSSANDNYDNNHDNDHDNAASNNAA